MHIVEIVAAFLGGLFIGFKYAKSKFSAGLSTVVADVKKL